MIRKRGLKKKWFYKEVFSNIRWPVIGGCGRDLLNR